MLRVRAAGLAGALGFLLAAAPAAVQQGSVAVQRVDLQNLPAVSVYLTVVDAAGASVLGVLPSELEVTLDGVPQPVTRLRSALEGGERLAIALLFDRSGSMKTGLGVAREAGREFLDRLSEQDEAAIVSFDTEVRVEAPLGRDRTRSHAALDAIERGSDTALYDAVITGIEAVEAASTRRRAVIVLTDGKDTRSQATYAQVVERATGAGVPVYAIGLPVESDQAALAQLAADTGGAYLRAGEEGDLRALYQLIAEQLGNQYLLEFESTFGEDGQWHDMRIAYRAAGGAPWSISRPFVASTGPGISRSRLDELSGGVARASLERAGLIGAVAGLLFGVALLLCVKIIRPEASVVSAMGLALIVIATLLGAVVGPLGILLELFP